MAITQDQTLAILSSRSPFSLCHSCRLRGQIVADATDIRDFVDDAIGHALGRSLIWPRHCRGGGHTPPLCKGLRPLSAGLPYCGLFDAPLAQERNKLVRDAALVERRQQSEELALGINGHGQNALARMDKNVVGDKLGSSLVAVACG